MRRLLAWLHERKDAAIVAAVFIVILGAVLAQNAHTQAVQRQQQAVQRQQGERAERLLCLAVGRQAALQPPAGNPKDNPSRAYLQSEHRTWTTIAAALRCPQ